MEAEKQKAAKKRKTSVSTSQPPTMEDLMEKSMKYPTSSAKCIAADNALMNMIAIDMQPLSIVENKGFVNFVHHLDRRYQLPSRKKISTTMLPEKY